MKIKKNRTWKFDFYKVGAKFAIWFDIANKSYMQKIKSDIYSLSLVWCTAKWSMENSHYFQNWHILIIISPITYQSSNFDQFICRFISKRFLFVMCPKQLSPKIAVTMHLNSFPSYKYWIKNTHFLYFIEHWWFSTSLLVNWHIKEICITENFNVNI